MEIIKAKSLIEDKYFTPRWMLIGDSGSGKTTSLTTWPKDQRMLVFDFWGNKESLVGADNIDIVSYSTLDPTSMQSYAKALADQNELVMELESGECPYSVVVYDTLTGLGDCMLYYTLSMPKAGGGMLATGPGGSPSEIHFRTLSHLMGTFIKRLIAYPIPLIVIAHLQPLTNKKGDFLGYEAVVWGKKTRATIFTYFSEVYRQFATPTDNEESVDKFGEQPQEFFWQTKSDLDWPMLKSVINTRGEVFGRFIDPDFTSLLKRRGLIK